ncbi:MAG: Crp/Fnr family transcriptional regulator [Caldimonas sp.]
MAIDRHGPGVLQDSVLQRVAARGGVRRYASNAILISEGDLADSMYIVLSGRVKVYASNEAGKEVVIAMHGAGEYVGELSLDGGVRSASVVTMEPTTCSVVPGVELREFLAENPDFALHLVRKLIWRVRQATDSVKSLALEDVYGRVLRLLFALSDPCGGERVVRERLTQQEIADRVGSSREMVNRIFKDLSIGGYLRVEKSSITIVKTPPPGW